MVAVNVTVTATPKSVEFVVKTEVATPLLFVDGDELLKLAVTVLSFVVGVPRVIVRPAMASPFISVAVKVIVVVSVTAVLPSATSPVPEIAMLPSPNVTVVLADKVPAVARTVAIPAVELVNVTSAFPAEFTSADEALNVPRVVVNSTVPDTLPDTVAVITERSDPSEATVDGLAAIVKESPVGEEGTSFPLVLSQPETYIVERNKPAKSNA